MGKDIAQEKAHFGAPRMWSIALKQMKLYIYIYSLLHAFLNSMLFIGNLLWSECMIPCCQFTSKTAITAE